MISDYALGVLRAPGPLSLLAESPLYTREAFQSTVQDQFALGAFGSIDYDIRRDVTLGAAQRTMKGSTWGSNLSPAFAPERTWGSAVVGVGAKFSPALSGNLALSSRIAQDDMRAWALQAGLSFGF